MRISSSGKAYWPRNPRSRPLMCTTPSKNENPRAKSTRKKAAIDSPRRAPRGCRVSSARSIVATPTDAGISAHAYAQLSQCRVVFWYSRMRPTVVTIVPGNTSPRDGSKPLSPMSNMSAPAPTMIIGQP
ncbi:MAG: hypothetical protein HYY42_00820 [Chloroflexi bacterium]|nr:hypothetical protein [Chloroflexota bacterium]